MSMSQVILENVRKVYDKGFIAVRDINLAIKGKEFLVIVGPSGCGKTTTLRMIAGLEDVTDGTIRIGDKIVNDVPPKDRDVAMVFQNYALYPHMTVFQNMAFGLKLRKYPKAEIRKRVQDAAKLLNIDDQLGKKPKALSGGQRQRVALGRAIVRNPKAFLFDEPLSNLDAKLRVTTRAELKAMHHRLQTTSIYVTHDQAEAMTLGDRICVMYNGQIQQVAPPMEVYDRPVNRFVAGFLGTPPMNFFEGSVQIKNNKPIFVFNDSTIAGLSLLNDEIASYSGREMVLGIRPEHLKVNPIEGQNENSLQARVNVVEPLGDRKDVHLTAGNSQEFIANLDPYVEINRGKRFMIYMDMKKAHFFEMGDIGRNIA